MFMLDWLLKQVKARFLRCLSIIKFCFFRLSYLRCMFRLYSNQSKSLCSQILQFHSAFRWVSCREWPERSPDYGQSQCYQLLIKRSINLGILAQAYPKLSLSNQTLVLNPWLQFRFYAVTFAIDLIKILYFCNLTLKNGFWMNYLHCRSIF